MKRKNRDQNLGSSLIKAVGEAGLADIATDAAEIALDSALDESLLKDIPVFGWFVKAYKTYTSISDRIFLKKVALFLYASSNISEEEKAKFQQKMNEEESYRRKVGENLILLLDRHDHFDKSIILGKLFLYLVKGSITYSFFLRLASAIDRAVIEDLHSLPKYYRNLERVNDQILHSLYTSGLVDMEIDAISGMKAYDYAKPNVSYNKNKVGETLVKVIKSSV